MSSNMDGISHVSCIATLLLENVKAKLNEDCLKGEEWNMGKHSPVTASCEGHKDLTEEWA